MKTSHSNINQNSHLPSIDLTNPQLIRMDTKGKSIGYFCNQGPIKVNHALVSHLKNLFITITDNKNLRLCLHDNPQALFHGMVILERKGKYYRPHKHLTKGETFHIIEGRMGIVCFDDNGKAIDACVLSTENNFIYRVEVNMYHATLPLSDIVIYHESKLGPFLGEEDSIYPSWAPDGCNQPETENYSNYLEQLLKSLK